MDPARVRRLGAYGVNHDGDGGIGPGLDQSGGLAVGDHQPHSGRRLAARLGHDRRSCAVVAAELVADADHHDRPPPAGAGSGAGADTSLRSVPIMIFLR
jgi:hypothetical protein